jgi:uncharacterized protein
MVDDRLRYDRMVERALRGVVRQALSQAAQAGLPGNHHFYLTFSTTTPGVELPEHLRQQYPDEMTIVLQHQFFGLEIRDDAFSVTLSFANKHERLTIPFASVTTFADPSVNFALQFQPSTGGAPPADDEPAPPPAEDDREATTAEEGGKIVTLDNFRKK